ncbi:x-box binding protein [Anaeramoeba flamelloides]|uniref:X-box binding protein n=1 Tax=Anaeramoeba flamelloides TaxID=1746091 RepID=A0ABQ8YLJ0_9EUKA|nr:x-box binding protein [Anaeramoeba flamelloides]
MNNFLDEGFTSEIGDEFAIDFSPFTTDTLSLDYDFGSQINLNDYLNSSLGQEKMHSNFEIKTEPINFLTKMDTIKSPTPLPFESRSSPTEMDQYDLIDLPKEISFQVEDLTEEQLAGKLSIEVIRKLSEEQKEVRRRLKNRLSAQTSISKIRNQIQELDSTVKSLSSNKKLIINKVDQAKKERKRLLKRELKLKRQLMKIRKQQNPEQKVTKRVIGSIKNTIHRLGTIPEKKEQPTTEMGLPETCFIDEQWTNIKNTLVKNTNNRTGFVMMIVILAITLVFGNEMVFGSSKNTTIPFFSNDLDVTRGLKENTYQKQIPRDKFADAGLFSIVEINDQETDDGVEQIETKFDQLYLNNPDDIKNLDTNQKNFDSNQNYNEIQRPL